MAEGNSTLPQWQCDSITFNHVLLLSLSETPESFDLILGCYYHQTAREKFDKKKKFRDLNWNLKHDISVRACAHVQEV